MIGCEDLACTLIGQGLEKVRNRVSFLARTDLMVLILGESGVGKELVAQGLARLSGRPMSRFFPVNAAALSDGLAESLLFGHVKGAFTGAVDSHEGLVSAARGGTLFLDEIGDISSVVQAKLLRVVEGSAFNRIGDTRSLISDTRLILATNADLPALVRRRMFREDLLHRLMEAVIEIPPLRQRKADIPTLLDHFMKQISRANDLRPVTFTDGALKVLARHSWPGNVRQLRNCVSLVMQEFPGEEITPSRASEKIRQSLGLRVQSKGAGRTRTEVEGAVREAEGNISRASELLGVSRRHMYRLLDEAENKAAFSRRSQGFLRKRFASPV